MHTYSTSERFAALDEQDRGRLDALSKLDHYAAGEQVANSDHPAEWLFLIVRGKVELRAGRDAAEVVLATLEAGDLFGELESFAQMPGLRYVALEETFAWALAKNPLKQELRLHRPLAAGMLSVYGRSISEKLRAASAALAALPADAHGLSRPPPPARAAGDAEEVIGPLGRPAHLSAEEAGWLALLGAQRTVRAGETIVREGDAGASFFVVATGRAQVRKRGVLDVEGERTLAELADGDLFGFMSFVDRKPRSASVIAVDDCVLAEIDAGALETALRLNFTVSFRFLGTLCNVLGRTFRDTAEQILLAASPVQDKRL